METVPTVSLISVHTLKSVNFPRTRMPPVLPPGKEFQLPVNYPRVRRVGSFQELAETPFKDGVNALCWPRVLPGNFGEVVQRLGPGEGEGVLALEAERLQNLAIGLSAAGQTAIANMLEDLRRLQARELDPVLNCIHQYPTDDDPGPVPTDVHSFHADSAPVPADTWLCTYYGPASGGLRNDQALRRVDIPETRAQLLRHFGGDDDDDFRWYLSENCFDLHYAPLPDARPFCFGTGNLWRIAVDWPGSPVPPCIHRAPLPDPGAPPRLLLIS